MAETIPFPGWRWARQFFASFQDVPTTGLHAVGSFVLAFLYVVVVMVGVVLGKPMDAFTIGTVGTFILGYLTKTSVDFAKKRSSDADTLVAQKLAERAIPPATVTVRDTAVTVTPQAPQASQAPRVLPADLDQALRAGNGSRPLAPAAPALLAQDG
jgi:hypothetical protein